MFFVLLQAVTEGSVFSSSVCEGLGLQDFDMANSGSDSGSEQLLLSRPLSARFGHSATSAPDDKVEYDDESGAESEEVKGKSKPLVSYGGSST